MRNNDDTCFGTVSGTETHRQEKENGTTDMPFRFYGHVSLCVAEWSALVFIQVRVRDSS